jgi:hypothetical protein
MVCHSVTELLKQQIEIKTSASNFIKSPPRQRRRNGKTGAGSVLLNDDNNRTWGIYCDSEMEDTREKVVQNHDAMDTGGKLHGGNKGERATGGKEAILGGGSAGAAINK